MLTHKGQITIRQAFVIMVMITLSPAIRLFPSICAERGKQAGWLAPIVSTAVYFLLYQMISVCFYKNEIQNLGDVFENSLGKIAGKVLLGIYLIWMFILFFLYIRYYADRILSSMMPDTHMEFFIIVILLLVYIAARGGVEAFARFTELSLIIMTSVCLVFIVMLMTDIKIENLLPVTYYDAWPVTRASFSVIGIWGYITYIFFFGEKIINKERIRQTGKHAMIYLAIMTTLLIVAVIGAIGYRVVEKMPLPFFSAIKVIAFLETLDRMESILLAVWLISDFIVITAFAFFLLGITKSIFEITEEKYLTTPFIFIGYIGSLLLASDRFELEAFSEKIGLWVNIVMAVVIPAIVIMIGKLRKKI